jgi:hypothetical protein
MILSILYFLSDVLWSSMKYLLENVLGLVEVNKYL